jgi:hypothetical protein
MPEFEENNTQPSPAYSYTPGTSTNQKKVTRRRSGGFKSEAASSNSKIGEVDPTEALQAEAAQKSNPCSDEVAEDAKTCSHKDSKASSADCGPEKTSKSKSTKPQPSEATLDSIKSVEAKIAKRLAENGKKTSTKTGSRSRNNNDRAHEKVGSKEQGGVLAAISRFFGMIFGSSPQGTSPSTDNPVQTTKGSNPRRQNSNSRRRQHKDGSQTRQKPSRGGQRSRRNNKPRNS